MVKLGLLHRIPHPERTITRLLIVDFAQVVTLRLEDEVAGAHNLVYCSIYGLKINLKVYPAALCHRITQVTNQCLSFRVLCRKYRDLPFSSRSFDLEVKEITIVIA